MVYFQDGQNRFDPLTAFLGNAWHAGHMAAELIRAGEIEPPIMVGIYNTGFARMDEYAPTRGAFSGWDGEPCRSRGRLRSYARFVTTEVKPFIDAHYPTLTGPEHTAVVGSSMGGLAALDLARWQPRVFGSAGWENTRRLREALVARGWREGAAGDLYYFWDTGAAHNEAAVEMDFGPGRSWHGHLARDAR